MSNIALNRLFTQIHRSRLFTSQHGLGTAPSRRYIPEKAAHLYQALDRSSSEIYSFNRSVEFIGRVRQTIDAESYAIVTVDPMVGKTSLANASTVCLVDRQGNQAYEPLFIDSKEDLPDGRIRLTLGKPGNIDSISINTLAEEALVTTNADLFPFRRSVFANYDEETITLYQAYRPEIGKQAVEQQNFGSNFSASRRTWVKPSFGWMMYRSNWGQNPGQEVILAIQLMRSTFDRLLEKACLTDPVLGVFYQTEAEYQAARKIRPNFVQWDPDRKIDGKRRAVRAIQLGIDPSFHSFFKQGIVSIADVTDLAKTILRLRDAGNQKYLDLLPIEAPYPTPLQVLRPLEAHQYFVDESQALMRSIIELVS
jgi:hypothetical protein